MYFKFFKLQDWGKRSVEGRRRNCVVLPFILRQKMAAVNFFSDEIDRHFRAWYDKIEKTEGDCACY